MFKRLQSDRREGYSFTGHLRRMLVTKGAARIGISLGSTAVIAAIAFAHCSSSSITGPNRGGGGNNAPSGVAQGPSKTEGLVTDTWLPPARFGPLKVPMTVIPPFSPCTQQVIEWAVGKQYTIMEGTTQSSTGGQLKTQFALASWALGNTAPPALQPPLADENWRKYAGTETYNSQERVYATGQEKFREEWNMKILSYGRNDERHDQDDFFLHVVVKVPPGLTDTQVMAFGYCKDADYGWWNNDDRYKNFCEDSRDH